MKNSKKDFVFLMIFVLVGIVLLFFGVKSTYSRMEKTKNYVSVEGRFIGSSIYSSDDDGTTYTLTYSYKVGGHEYQISTDYGTGSVPDIGTKKDIKYNPDNPNEAVITGMGSNAILLILGFMFTVIPLIPLLSPFFNSTNLIDSKVKDKLYSILIGAIFTITGGAFYYLMCSSGNSLSIIYALKTNGLWVFIPLVFIIVGIYVIAASFFSKNSKVITIENHDEVVSNQNYVASAENQVIEEKINNVVDKVEKVSSIGAPVIQMIAGLIFTLACTWIFILGADGITKMAIVPFLICGLSILFTGVISLIQNIVNFNGSNNYNDLMKKEKINNDLNKFQAVTSQLYIIGFLIFWFGFLILFDYQAIKTINEGGTQLLLFSLIFWAAGIFVAYKQFKKRV